MKTLHLLCSLLAFATAASSAHAQRVNPTPPSLSSALKLSNNEVLVFRPTRMGKAYNLDVTHLQLTRAVLKTGEKRFLQLVVYASKPNQTGGNDIIFTDTQQISDGTSNTVTFARFNPTTNALPYIEQDNRVGIIAILIGFRQVGTGPFQAVPLPASDTIAVEVNPGDGSFGLLLPAVQKVRAAAARL